MTGWDDLLERIIGFAGLGIILGTFFLAVGYTNSDNVSKYDPGGFLMMIALFGIGTLALGWCLVRQINRL